MKYTVTPLNSLIHWLNIFRLVIVITIIVLNGLFNIVEVSGDVLISSRTLGDVFSLNTILFYIWSSVYFLIIGFFAFYNRLRLDNKFSLFYLNTLDIIMMSFFVYLTGNISGFGILIIPFVATASLLETSRYNLFYGAVATISILMSVVIKITFSNAYYSDQDQLYLFFQSGALSAVCLVVSYVTSILAKGLSRVTEASINKEEEIINLNRLNELVLQRLSDVVVVLDKDGGVRQYNVQARRYFSFLKIGGYFHVFQPILNEWKETDKKLFSIEGKLNNVSMSGRAISVDEFGDKLLLLLLRSAEDLANESRKVKLESLGRLTANIAHEIRNPLSAIRQSNELLSESNDDKLTQKFTRIVGKNVQRIDQLVEEVLTLNKRDRTQQIKIDISQFIIDFVNEFELAKPEAKGRIRVKVESVTKTILFDHGHLEQILWNLVNNAWQHADKEYPIVIIYVVQQNDIISLSVSDSGPGVSRNVVDHIFEPFFTTEKQGTGLGLYIARELALANNAYLDYITRTKRFELTFRVKEND